MNREGKEVIYENFVTKDIVLDWKGQSHFFASKHDFIIFFLNQLDIDISKIIINSLATPFLYFIILILLNKLYYFGKKIVRVMSQEIWNSIR